MKPAAPSNFQSKPTISTSRRNFVKGIHVALGAGVALGVSAALGRKAHAGIGRHGHSGGQGHCFLAGTLIRTASGLVAVEELRVGSSVLTVSGEAKPVKWIGKRKDASEAPVKISKFAIDGKAPLRDLFVSPRHAIYIDGFLVPAINFVNGTTIIAYAKSNLPTFAYYHIEFETHEVIEAEGLAVESYLPQSGVDFDNADEYLSLYGPRPHPMTPFARVLSHDGIKQELKSYIRSSAAYIYDMRGPLDKIRDRIADQAELAKAA
jgi:Hint domain